MIISRIPSELPRLRITGSRVSSISLLPCLRVAPVTGLLRCTAGEE
jgi:hypothetical protein